MIFLLLYKQYRRRKKMRKTQSLSKETQKIKDYQKLPALIKEKGCFCFGLSGLASNEDLMSNEKFKDLYNTIYSYNKKLEQFGEDNLTNFKMHEFLYSCLLSCKTKLKSEITSYLDFIHNQVEKLNNKRKIMINGNAKSPINQDDETLVRKTFKSNLPLQINQFKRRVFGSSFEAQLSDFQFLKSQKNKSNDKFSYLNQKGYRTELDKMLKKQQERQHLSFLRQKKKNYSKVQSLTCNDFFKPMWNKNCLMKQNKYAPEKNETFFKTSISFQTKKLKEKNSFHVADSIHESSNRQDQQYHNIDGLTLMKNPFQQTKKSKKDK